MGFGKLDGLFMRAILQEGDGGGFIAGDHNFVGAKESVEGHLAIFGGTYEVEVPRKDCYPSCVGYHR